MNKCLNCDYKFDAATSMFNEAQPKPGDITVCLRCGHIMAFTKSLAVRNLTNQEKREVTGDPRIQLLEEARRVIMKKAAH